MTLKDVVYQRIKSVLYQDLKERLKSWDWASLITLVDTLITENHEMIEGRLTSKPVTLTNIDDVIQEIVREILTKPQFK